MSISGKAYGLSWERIKSGEAQSKILKVETLKVFHEYKKCTSQVAVIFSLLFLYRTNILQMGCVLSKSLS